MSGRGTPTTREELITAERLVQAAAECLCSAYSVIETNIDNAHPTLVQLGAALEEAEVAAAALGYEIRVCNAEIVGIRSVDP